MSEAVPDVTTFRQATQSAESWPDSRLLDNRSAFDSVAADYDGPTGNNKLIRRMRGMLWTTVCSLLPKGARLLDLGCGTGIDAEYFASLGYKVLGTDWSALMVQRTLARATKPGLGGRIDAQVIGLQELEKLEGMTFDGIYSDLGPLNCVPDLAAVSRACSRLLAPGGVLVASVIGRVCPWELAYYAVKGDWKRARLRAYHDAVPVNLNEHTVWTRYYAPAEFFSQFGKEFVPARLRALGLFAPPPYLIHFYERHVRLCAPLLWADDHLGSLPGLREWGDHFLAVLTKRG